MLQSPVPTKMLVCALLLVTLTVFHPALGDWATSSAQTTLTSPPQSIADLSLPPLGTPQGRPRGGGSRNCDNSRPQFA